MELGTASILVQLLLIFVLVSVFAGRRHLKARRERRSQPPGTAPLSALPVPAVRVAAAVPFPAATLTDLPLPRESRPAARPPVATARQVAEELLPPCFADTCADWAQVDHGTSRAPITRFSLADWSAPTDRVTLDETPALQELAWASHTPVPPVPSPRPVRPAAERRVVSAMSCTIAPQAYPFA